MEIPPTKAYDAHSTNPLIAGQYGVAAAHEGGAINFAQRAISTLKHVQLRFLDSVILDALPGTGHEARGLNTAAENDDTEEYPHEFLNVGPRSFPATRVGARYWTSTYNYA